MDIFDDYWLLVLYASNAVLLVAASLAIAQFRRQIRRLEQHGSRPAGTADSEQTMSPERQLLLMNRRLERRLSDLQKYLHAMPANDCNTNTYIDRPLPIDNAIRMAKSGASVDELTRSCGLNIGEARLMQKLHRNADFAATA